MTIPLVLYLYRLYVLLTRPTGSFCSTSRCVLRLNVSTVVPFLEIGFVIRKSSAEVLSTPSSTFIPTSLRPQSENLVRSYFRRDLATAWQTRTKYLSRIAGAPRNDGYQDETSGQWEYRGWIRCYSVDLSSGGYGGFCCTFTLPLITIRF